MVDKQIENLIDAACTNCKVRVEAIKRFRRYGLSKAIEYIRSVPGYNADVVKLLQGRETDGTTLRN